MSNIFLSPEVIVLLFVTLSLAVVLTFAAFKTVQLLKHYKPNAATQEQYTLEKSSYLITTIIQVSLFINIFLLALFTHTLNSLSDIIPGAMCAAGVVSSNSFGNPLIVLKVAIIISSLIWLRVNKEDFITKEHPYFKRKYLFFLLIFTLFLIDTLLELTFFAHLSTTEPVLCCSHIYNNTPSSFKLSNTILVTLFYTLYLLLLLTLTLKKRLLSAAFSLLFLYVSYLSITYFFSTYIYELPTHKCPYCILSADYGYIGYFIYASLILASSFSLSASIFSKRDDLWKKALLWYTLFILIVSVKLIYYISLNHSTL